MTRTLLLRTLASAVLATSFCLSAEHVVTC